ncbi:MAG TPA: SpoIIE family protein phosphatase [Thermoanaerobaculia bacterium]|nr:SpoIIE family protein phosphatase [Thermoanaerobaculia bacterium]
MRLRTQLVLAAFLLAVVPLVAIVVYSYETSHKALEEAYQRQAARMTRQMDARLTSIRAELDSGLAGLSALPIERLPAGNAKQSTTPMSEILMAMGDAAPLVDAISIEPAHPPAPPAPPQHAAPHPEAHPEVQTAEAPIVIDIPAMPHFELPADFHEKVAQIQQLSRSEESMSADERKAAKEKIQALNEELQSEMQARTADFQVHVDAAVKRRNAKVDQNGNVPVEAPAAEEAPPVVVVKKMSEERRQEIRQRARQAALLLGHDFNAPLHTDGKVVGHVTAQIKPDEVIRRVLGTPIDDSEVAFAVDKEGHLYTRNDAERKTVESLGLQSRKNVPGWIVTSKDAGNGVRLVVARKVGDELEELRKTAARNFGYGLGLVLIALIGIVPLANHMSRDVQTVTAGAERIASGDLQTRVPVRSKSEFGQLAVAFNRMAHDLSEQRQRLYQEERARHDQEVQQKILEGKAAELEEARRFQLSLLPKDVPQIDRFHVGAFTQTATEVGGDYYDFRVLKDSFTVAIGDATGHGAKAGTMVTIIKTLFSSYAEEEPGAFLGDATERIKRMALERMSMALSLARIEGDRLTIASAGMPPLLVHRAADSRVEEIAFSSTPLGTLGSVYEQKDVALADGDTVLFMTDGFPELTNGFGQQLGYTAAAEAFANVAGGGAQDVIDGLVAQAREWHGDQPPNDDITFVVVRVRRTG